MSASTAHYETIVRVDSGVPSTRAEWQGQAQQQSGEAAWLEERVESAQSNSEYYRERHSGD
eukprot:COSAG05_NODE_5236_length_1229_cov_1.266372_2_plen_61_part_00